MCLTCYQNISLKSLIEQLKEIEKIDNTYDFSIWNTTSLSFLYIMLNDERLKHYHYIIVHTYGVINKDKKKILTSINNNSLENRAFDIFNLIEKKISSNE
tara:strand:- start:264 stop:563 length:300 start_codon:yes stop_codon:yes gene_type:complete